MMPTMPPIGIQADVIALVSTSVPRLFHEHWPPQIERIARQLDEKVRDRQQPYARHPRTIADHLGMAAVAAKAANADFRVATIRLVRGALNLSAEEEPLYSRSPKRNLRLRNRVLQTVGVAARQRSGLYQLIPWVRIEAPWLIGGATFLPGAGAFTAPVFAVAAFCVAAGFTGRALQD